MKLLSKIYTLQSYLASASTYFQSLEAWSRNHVFQVTNVPSPPPPPHPAMLMELDQINTAALCAAGGERELYDYVRAVSLGLVYPADREKVSNPLEWKSEHYQFTNNYSTVRFLSVMPVKSADLPALHHRHRNQPDEGARYLVGPDGTWYLVPEDAKLGWSADKEGLSLKLNLSFAKSSIEGETMPVRIMSGGGCTSFVRETLTIGQPVLTVTGMAPLEYVTQEEFDAAVELHIPGSLIDHQERLKERVYKVFTALIPKEEDYPPLAHLTSSYRYDAYGRRTDCVCLGTRSDEAYVSPESEYSEAQLAKARSSTGYALYLKVDSYFAYGITEGGREWLFEKAWPGMTIAERLGFYVSLLSVYQHNHDDNYSAGGIFRNLDKLLA